MIKRGISVRIKILFKKEKEEELWVFTKGMTEQLKSDEQKDVVKRREPS